MNFTMMHGSTNIKTSGAGHHISVPSILHLYVQFRLFPAIKSSKLHVPLFALFIGNKIPKAVPQLTQRQTSELLPARLHI
jgi:hypothetical protein